MGNTGSKQTRQVTTQPQERPSESGQPHVPHGFEAEADATSTPPAEDAKQKLPAQKGR
jgi:hypothetical protein